MINLFTEYYLCKEEERQKEINYCLKANANNCLIDNFYVIVHNPDEEEKALHLSEKIKTLHVDTNRPTYGQIFSLINVLTKAEDINIFANSDIFYDSSLALLQQLDQESAICLSRWNVVTEEKDKIYVVLQHNSAVSQDSWIFRGPIRKELEKVSFSTGRPACDHALAYAIRKAGYFPFNPCLSVKSYHLHKSAVRNYSLKDLVKGPYFYVLPRKWQERASPFLQTYILIRSYYMEALSRQKT